MSLIDTQPAPRKCAPKHTRKLRKRPRTVYLDPTVLDATLRNDQLHRATRSHTPRVVNIDDLASGVRANVRDAARAVLAWLSAVTTHGEGIDLNAVLRRCLRPGGDVTRLNCAAMAKEIQRHTGVELSPKRVRTAILHLRDTPAPGSDDAIDLPASDESPTPNLQDAFVALAGRLRANFEALTCSVEQGDIRRELGTDILAAVRCAVGRVITHGFGEGIPDHVDLDELSDRFREFVISSFPRRRESTLESSNRLYTVDARLRGHDATWDAAHDLRRLLVTLTDHDGTAEADMQLIVDGARVVCDLLSADSLAGVLARLNVLVAGRSLIDTPVYVGQMEALAAQAVVLHDDGETKSYLNWSRRLPEDSRVPSPLRVASYCRNNATTRVLERIYLGVLDINDAVSGGLSGAEKNLAAMIADDPGFPCLRVTQAIHATVVARLNDDTTAADFFRGLGEERTIALLGDLMRYDNCPDLVASVRKQAEAVWPGATHRFICV